MDVIFWYNEQLHLERNCYAFKCSGFALAFKCYAIKNMVIVCNGASLKDMLEYYLKVLTKEA